LKQLLLVHKFVHKKMQSKMADFAPVPPHWRTGRNIRVVFDSGLLNS